MELSANAKINVGLQVVSRRPDGYHNLETVFYPIPLSDTLYIDTAEQMDFRVSGIAVGGNPEQNLVMKAYRLLEVDFSLPPVSLHLHKRIPFGAGLGGGSSDAAFTLKGLNELFHLGIEDTCLQAYASRLGADCAFFVQNKPLFAYGIGNEFAPLQAGQPLSGYYLLLIKPAVSISTAEAYRHVVPHQPGCSLQQCLVQPLSQWNQRVKNDFEASVFRQFPEVEVYKQCLYEAGALYASMSGSGSALFGLFSTPPVVTSLLQNALLWAGWMP